MDSRLRRMAIAASLGVILLVSLLVVYTNQEKDRRKTYSSYTQTTTGQTAGQQAAPNTTTEVSRYEQVVQNGQIGNDLKAFLQDNTFFDPVENKVLEAAKSLKKQLSLMITSVEKDLRVQIVDAEGALVAGESFYVSLAGLGEYKDLDQDGIIYIGDLDSGEYNIKLLPISGYQVPETETKVQVKQKVEYVPISDISLLIKTEDEVDPKVEDTGEQGALDDADNTEIQQLQKPGGSTKAGIDVSKWNKEIDWDKVKNAGIEFAIIRAGYRGSSTGALVEDPYFRANIKGATASGLKVGVYFFTQAVNEVEAVEEASAVLNMIKEYKLDYPIFIDTEGAGGNGRADGLNAETRTLVCEAFCRTIENAGYKAGVYASRNWYNNALKTQRLNDYYIWLAEYRSTPLYQGYYKMWQYTSKGQVDGINGNVDLNIAYE